jgi:hypothetical protein
MDWKVLREIFPEFFVGGTSTFMTSIEDAKDFAENRMILPFPDITDDDKAWLVEQSEINAMTAGFEFGYWETQGAERYWQLMTESVRQIGNDELTNWFSNSEEIAGETVVYEKEGLYQFDLPKIFKIPWPLIIGAAFLLLWRK